MIDWAVHTGQSHSPEGTVISHHRDTEDTERREETHCVGAVENRPVFYSPHAVGFGNEEVPFFLPSQNFLKIPKDHVLCIRWGHSHDLGEKFLFFSEATLPLYKRRGMTGSAEGRILKISAWKIRND